MSDDERFQVILIECLAAIEAGATADQLAARYPVYAAPLDAALRVAIRLRTLDHDGPPRAVQARARAAFLARAAEMRPVSRRASSARWLLRPLVSFLTVMALVAIVGSGVLVASAASLPGDPLYAVKRSFEGLQLSLVRDPLQRANLEESYTRQRTEEVRAVQASSRVTRVQFAAPLEAMAADKWIVGGFTVQVPPGIPITGTPQVGEFVEIAGRTLPDAQIVAEQIKVEGVRFVGVVEAMNAPVWGIGGRRVLVTSRTQIVGTPQLGAQVEVRARMFPDGTLLALQIELTQGPTAPPRPVVTATPVPHATATLRPTQPLEVATPHPTVIREQEPEATPALRPTEDHGGQDTPEAEPTEGQDGNDVQEPEPPKDHEDKDTPEP